MVEVARLGESAAFEVLVRRYQTVAFRTAWLITRNAADAEEVAQEAFVKAWRNLGRFDRQRGLQALSRRKAPITGEGAFRPWLLTIVANEARNLGRSRRRRPESALGPELLELAVDPEAVPAIQIERSEAQAELLAALAELPERDRIALELRYFLDLNEAEMAIVLGVARGTVKSRLSRALARLRDALEPRQEADTR